ncbi:hypothetical protein BDP81DRAFT_493924 [Colletotrichum phormii]|uniref:Uncharacterized protein n=1 Tax=Colletotrichum phormii TaxID=359342 RepID=A0AAI9ZMS6_9PEZI|nr:uncharacterized protein BDP81DRAFT_493924 [Colletotrichum phormii]KAK1634551.1 hypothetical protein BDP81DRAFT_493924 [Colletotrichum phormii]
MKNGIVRAEFLHADVGWGGILGERDAGNGRNDKDGTGRKSQRQPWDWDVSRQGRNERLRKVANTRRSHRAIHFLSGMDTEDQKERRHVTFNGSEIPDYLVFEHRATSCFLSHGITNQGRNKFKTWSHVVSGHRLRLCLEFVSSALVKERRCGNNKARLNPSGHRTSGPSTCRLDAGPANTSIDICTPGRYRSQVRWHRSVKDGWCVWLPYVTIVHLRFSRPDKELTV